ncbi:bifunctional epoxide hydrolase 2-like [Heracleum sosnowskyi]|uniref:Bifunctional epoxide hydrolase 2-like n=1 Tax=Heracleum sosnowskyi TaxID=360622 RepID=A0AAD8I455_9APIA|nr:bifunctional epoxide hydrolase 2-like [Heracleum sosnowskyi]
MEKIEHKYIQVNGLKHHVADIGSSSGSPITILFLHGFPELWYTWRFQMIAVAKAGYRAIAPDYRGYGWSDTPSQPEKATFADFVSDMAAILDALDISKVFVIGQDVGGIVAYRFALCHPSRIHGIVTLGIPFMSPGPIEYHKLLPEGFYITRWQEPGRAEADFARFDAKTVVRNIYILFARSEIPIAPENQEIMDIVEPSTPLPSWFTEEDLAVYGAAYEKCGFQTALQVPYREFRRKENTEQPSNTPDLKVEAPALFITGEKDYVFKFPEMENYIKSGAVKMFVPSLETEYIPEGSHFISEQFPDKVNELILSFISKNIQD